MTATQQDTREGPIRALAGRLAGEKSWTPDHYVIARSYFDRITALAYTTCEADRRDAVCYRVALNTIAELPIPEQDNMLSANMRRIARAALNAARIPETRDAATADKQTSRGSGDV